MRPVPVGFTFGQITIRYYNNIIKTNSQGVIALAQLPRGISPLNIHTIPLMGAFEWDSATLVSHYFACAIVSIVVQTSELSSAFGGGFPWYFVVAVAFVSV
jgi:hypothetical protein